MKTYNEIVDNLEKLIKELPSKLQDKGNEVLAEAKLYTDEKFSAGLKRQIVETLPTEDIDANTIYMVLDESSSQVSNVYNEYMYINSSWELIGTTKTASVALYQHNIYFRYSLGNVKIVSLIISGSSTPFTFETLKSYLLNNGFTSNVKGIIVSGTASANDTAFLMYATNTQICVAGNGSTTVNLGNVDTLIDTVAQII